MAKPKKNHSSKPSPDKENLNNLARYSGIAFEIVALNLLLVWGGYKLDKHFEFSFPWMVILSLILAIIGTIYLIFKRLNQ